jgi:hypothetical protein
LTTPHRRAVDQAILDAPELLEGEVLSVPALQTTDGAGTTWCVDVKVARSEMILRNIPLAIANRDISYAQVGMPITLRKYKSGRLEVIGFSKRKPGRRSQIAVDLASRTAGTPVDLTLSVRMLTYGELGTFGGYGVVPYGAYGIFRGGELVELRT